MKKGQKYLENGVFPPFSGQKLPRLGALQVAGLFDEVGVENVPHHRQQVGAAAAVLHDGADGDLGVLHRAVGDDRAVQIGQALFLVVVLGALGAAGLDGDGHGEIGRASCRERV